MSLVVSQPLWPIKRDVVRGRVLQRGLSPTLGCDILEQAQDSKSTASCSFLYETPSLHWQT